jgi:signal transduction histidine kinase
MSNLLENALRHTPAGTTAMLSAGTLATTINVVLEDDGPGVSDDDAKRLFQRFARAEASRTTAGHGLGLALVQAIAVGHGGEARLSQTSAGFGVMIRLPRAAAS